MAVVRIEVVHVEPRDALLPRQGAALAAAVCCDGPEVSVAPNGIEKWEHGGRGEHNTVSITPNRFCATEIWIQGSCTDGSAA